MVYEFSVCMETKGYGTDVDDMYSGVLMVGPWTDDET